MELEVRTRFAPSPSGFLHVGGARTALFNYLYAKARKGKFILRIEDTDQNRSTEESFKTILESMKWLGLNWDEGPGIGGEYGPYIQSQRIDIYKKYTDQLIQEKKAYPCFCTPEELEHKKKTSEAMGVANIYDGTCLHKTEEEIQLLLDKKISYSVRFKTQAKTIVINDIIQDKVKFDTKLIGDFIIVKSDGFPSYNYAVVIDDYLMKITHVIRGVGHLSNTPRQILIHEAFDFPIPQYAHASEIVGTDGKKLSKRAGATSVLAFKDLGYTKECFVNYMALLGWTSEDGVEYLPQKRIEEIFEISRCSKSPAMFDVFKKMDEKLEPVEFNALTADKLADFLNPKSKLNWLSNKYIREMDIDYIIELTLPFIESNSRIPNEIKSKNNELLRSILNSIRVYLDRLQQAPPYIEEFFNNDILIEDDVARQIIDNESAKQVANTFLYLLQTTNVHTSDEYKVLMETTGKQTNQKGKNLFMPIRVATTGKSHGLELPVLFHLLGKDKLIYRIQKILSQLK